jgi:hypothetical protein
MSEHPVSPRRKTGRMPETDEEQAAQHYGMHRKSGRE